MTDRPVPPPPPVAFDGETYEAPIDFQRMDTQFVKVWEYMKDSRWHYPAEMEDALHEAWASISARVRDPRKEKWAKPAYESWSNSSSPMR